MCYRMGRSNIWWMDGTFTSVPTIFAQLHIVHVKVHNEFFPQLFCLLPDKCQVMYERLFHLMNQKLLVLNNQPLQPATIHIDFEQAFIGAIRSKFCMHVMINGCLLHFWQHVIRHLQTAGLQVQYNTNNPPEVRTIIRRLMGLTSSRQSDWIKHFSSWLLIHRMFLAANK